MNRNERNRQQAEMIVRRISQNLEIASANHPIRAYVLIRTFELRKYQLYSLLSNLRRLEPSEKQRHLIRRVKRRLFVPSRNPIGDLS